MNLSFLQLLWKSKTVIGVIVTQVPALLVGYKDPIVLAHSLGVILAALGLRHAIEKGVALVAEVDKASQ